MLAYDIVKSFPYKERKDNLRIPREVATIIKDGNIVCVGYSQLLSQILKETGVDSYTISTSVPVGDDVIGHERNVIVVDDDKYDIHGNYAFDVTWDSAKNITKCIDSEGKNVLRSKSSPILDTDQVVKHYDNLVLYRYFLTDIIVVFQGNLIQILNMRKKFLHQERHLMMIPYVVRS